MPDKPARELTIDEPLVRRLVETQAGCLLTPGAPVVHVEDGWDCSVWRIGTAYAARLPRRAAAAELTVNEHRFLHPIADRLTAAGLGCPEPVVHGVPDAEYPWAWSVVPWFDGSPGLDVARAARRGWAARLAAGVRAIHRAADGEFPRNPVRGVPIAARADVVGGRLAALRDSGTHETGILTALRDAWQAGVDAPPWGGDPVWMHGDLHPGNIIAQGSELTALIDFGDLTAGDPASDLATAWLTFDTDGRAEFVDALRGHVDEATWTRARAWAASLAAMLMQHSDDNPRYARLGAETAHEIAIDTVGS